MKYAVIDAHLGELSVVRMCRVLGVTPSGFYAWRRRPPSERMQRDQTLSAHVRAAFNASKGRYGSPRVHAQLRAAGHRVARKRVARLMRDDGLRARPRRRYVVTTQSRHSHPIARNLVKRKFDVTAPNRVWVSDLTYLRTVTGFVYLAVVLDLFSRRVVGWKVSREADAGLAVEAVRRALALRSPPYGLIHHSDRGVHYACSEYRALLDGNCGCSLPTPHRSSCTSTRRSRPRSKRTRCRFSRATASRRCTSSSPRSTQIPSRSARPSCAA